jgi:hypothetical protein
MHMQLQNSNTSSLLVPIRSSIQLIKRIGLGGIRVIVIYFPVNVFVGTQPDTSSHLVQNSNISSLLVPSRSSIQLVKRIGLGGIRVIVIVFPVNVFVCTQPDTASHLVEGQDGKWFFHLGGQFFNTEQKVRQNDRRRNHALGAKDKGEELARFDFF